MICFCVSFHLLTFYVWSLEVWNADVMRKIKLLLFWSLMHWNTEGEKKKQVVKMINLQFLISVVTEDLISIPQCLCTVNDSKPMPSLSVDYPLTVNVIFL